VLLAPVRVWERVRLDPAEWTPQDPQEVAAHETLKALRDKVYAHIDSVIKIGGEKVRARDVERIEDLLGTLEDIDWNAPEAPPMFTEGWVPLNREALPGIAAFAHVQEARLIEQQRALEAQRARGVRGGATLELEEHRSGSSSNRALNRRRSASPIHPDSPRDTDALRKVP
jgi:hypothetical protein